MNHQSVTLDLPEELYERIRRAAEDSQRPLESVLIETIALMFGDLHVENLSPEELNTFGDEQLWAIVYRPLAWPLDSRLHELTALGKSRDLSADEKAEIDTLVEALDHYILLRSKALLILKQRGHDVEQRLKILN